MVPTSAASEHQVSTSGAAEALYEAKDTPAAAGSAQALAGEQSRFSEEDAARLALVAVRLQVGPRPRPQQPLLSGKEQQLLDDLRGAEKAHDRSILEASAEQQRLEAMPADRDLHDSFHGHIAAALHVLSEMSDDGRQSLAWFAHSTGSPGDDDQEDYLSPIMARFESSLREMSRASDMASAGVAFARGRKPGMSQAVGSENVALEPLNAFVDEFRPRWEATTGTKFKVEFGEVVNSDGIRETKPISAAARLVFEAAQKFRDASGKPLYSMGAVERAMRRSRKSAR